MHPLLRRLVLGDDEAIAAVLAAAETSDDPLVLVTAALFAGDADGLLTRAGAAASTTRDRQLVAIAVAHHRGDPSLVDALARDHLVDHPDSVLAAWIADANHVHPSTRKAP